MKIDWLKICRTQRCIYKPDEHPQWSFFAKTVKYQKLLFSQKSSTIGIQLSSKYACRTGNRGTSKSRMGMPEIKTLKGNFKKWIMQITYNFRKVKNVNDRVLKVTCKIWKLLNKSAKSIKNETKNTKICSKISPNRKLAPCRD